MIDIQRHRLRFPVLGSREKILKKDKALEPWDVLYKRRFSIVTRLDEYRYRSC